MATSKILSKADYVVEQGTSGDWTYRKWNSGFCEAWSEQSFTFAAQTASGSMYTSAANITVDLPSGLFTSVILPIGELKSYSMTVTMANYTTSAISFRPLSTTSRASTSWTVGLYVIGTWK